MEVCVGGDWRTVTDVTHEFVSYWKNLSIDSYVTGTIPTHNAKFRFQNPCGVWIYIKLELGMK